MKTKIIYQEASIEDVFRFWVEAYQPKDSTKILSWESFYDPSKERVVFKMVVEDKSGS